MGQWTVYILKSKKDGRSYVGSTNNLNRRLKEHENGHVDATKNRRPLELIYKEEYESEFDARSRERRMKSGSGRRFLKKLF